jgi:hypothetical protein
MHHISSEIQRCIQNCLDCHRVCLQMAMNHCLELGGQHTEPKHFRLMLNCAEICQTSANFMLTGSDLHKLIAQADLRRLCPDLRGVCPELRASW